MSVTFYSNPRCDCVTRWSDASDAGLPAHPADFTCERCLAELNLCNANAADLLAWLDLPCEELYGQAPAREVAAKCRRRLWDIPRNHDAALDEIQLSERAVVSGRPAGYLREKTQRLLKLAEMIGDGELRWD